MSLESPPRIGFIGLGSIGLPIAEQILRAGHEVVAYDARPSAVASLLRADAAECPADVADRTDIVFTCLSSADSHRDAVLGSSGLVRGSRARLCVHLGTTGAALVAELTRGLAVVGTTLLDAPITGGVPAARKGQLVIMASGDRGAFSRVEPLLRCYGSKIVYFGEEPGLAQTMKIVNNMVALANLAVASEAVVVGVKAGLSATTMLDVLNAGSAQSRVTSDKLPHYILPRTFDFGGALEVVLKDVQLFLEESERFSVSTPLARAVRDVYSRAVLEGSASDDLTTVIRVTEREAGITVSSGAGP